MSGPSGLTGRHRCTEVVHRAVERLGVCGSAYAVELTALTADAPRSPESAGLPSRTWIYGAQMLALRPAGVSDQISST